MKTWILGGLLAFVAAGLSAAPVFFIDPGHGAGDPGVHVGDLNEADLVFEIAGDVQELLKAQGVDCVLSRDASSCPALSDRVAAANASGAEAFLSLHINDSTSPNVRGSRVFIAKALAPQSPGQPSLWNQAAGIHAGQAKSLALDLARELSAEESYPVGVQSLNLADLKGLNMPGVMVELGFLSNAESKAHFEESQYRKALAGRLAQGLLSWLRTAGAQAAPSAAGVAP